MRILTPTTQMRLFVANGIVLHYAGFDLPLGDPSVVEEFEEKLLDGKEVLAVRAQWSGLNYHVLPEEASPRAKQLGEVWSRAMTETFSGRTEKERGEAREKATIARTYLEREWYKLTKAPLRIVAGTDVEASLRGGLS